jgi:hypothetical protein
MASETPKYVRKMLGYRRAMWLGDDLPSADFERFVRQALTKLTTIASTAITRDSGQVLSCLSRELRPKGGVFLHVTAMTPGSEASVISRSGMDSSSGMDVGTLSAPDGSEFMNGDVFLFVRKDNVCVCANAIHDGTIRNYFHNLFQKAQLNELSTKFDLVSVANLERVKFIHDHGIKSITLNAALFKASNDLARNSRRTRGGPGAVAKFLTAMFGKENDITNDSIVVKLTLETDGRVRKHIKLGEQRLEHWAVDLVTHEEPGDNYVIVTKDKQVIKPDELKVQKLCSVLVKGNSVDREDAWKELLDFYADLCETGAVEE